MPVNFRVRNFWPSLLLVAVIVWTFSVQREGHYQKWAEDPILLGAPVLALWHLRLIYAKPEKAGYVLYAVINLALYLLLGFWGLIIISPI
jgi:hypothetical protein